MVMGYGALLARAVLAPDNKPMRIMGAVVSGTGLFLIILGGFGMKARLHYDWPMWLNIKIVIWLLLGAALSMVNKKPEWNKVLWIAIIVLAGFAAWLGVFGNTVQALQ
tara:strand:- start:6548 stop:6871 length:324 start_codon:yes stop_codon:yes gene_type:complete